MGNNPMVGMTVAVAVAIEEACKQFTNNKKTVSDHGLFAL